MLKTAARHVCIKDQFSNKGPGRRHDIPDPLIKSRRVRSAAPPVDTDKQEQPHHINEMPVPGGRFKAEMLCWREVTTVHAHQADCQEDCSNQNMEPVKAGRHIEG